jgi:hypothetical protein
VQSLIDQVLFLVCHFFLGVVALGVDNRHGLPLFHPIHKKWRLLTKEAASGEAACQQGGWLKNELGL